MKLLLDQNLSHKMLKSLNKDFPHSSHVYLLNLHTVADKEIWQYAKNNNYTLVTPDSDFNDLSLLFGHPPKVIWIKTGNTSTVFIENLLLANKNDLYAFNNSNESCLILY